MRLAKAIILFAGFTISSCAYSLVWPTANPAFLRGEGLESYIQPTTSGRLESGTFGCVRNGGYRFHAGVDLKPLRRNKQGEALDAIYAITDGTVVYLNAKPSKSSFGRYIVLEHISPEGLKYLSLYAHLSAIEPALKIGQKVAEGQKIGIMGRSANTPMPKERAHLHFQLSLLYSDKFSLWYAKQKFKEPNIHGNFNGLNMASVDPLDFYTKVQADPSMTMLKYIQGLSTALVVYIKCEKIPDIVARYPKLYPPPNKKTSNSNVWKIELTAHRFVKSLTLVENMYFKDDQIKIIHFNQSLIEKNLGSYLLEKNKKGTWIVGKKLQAIVRLLQQ